MPDFLLSLKSYSYTRQQSCHFTGSCSKHLLIGRLKTLQIYRAIKIFCTACLRFYASRRYWLKLSSRPRLCIFECLLFISGSHCNNGQFFSIFTAHQYSHHSQVTQTEIGFLTLKHNPCALLLIFKKNRTYPCHQGIRFRVAQQLSFCSMF